MKCPRRQPRNLKTQIEKSAPKGRSKRCPKKIVLVFLLKKEKKTNQKNPQKPKTTTKPPYYSEPLSLQFTNVIFAT